MLNPYKIYFIPKTKLDELTINTIGQKTSLIDHFIKKKAIVVPGSYILYDKSEECQTLFNLLYDIHLKINNIYENHLPKKEVIEREMLEGYLEEFRE